MKEVIKTDRAPGGNLPFSQALRVGDFIYTAGQGPLDPKTGAVVDGTIEEQTTLVLQNIAAILEAAGASLKDVVKVTAHLQNITDWARFNETYLRHFAPPYPVRTTVGSDLGKFLVEIDVVAYAPRR